MRLSDVPVSGLLYAVEGIGAVFISLFLFVYLAGLTNLPGNVVYHSDPAFRVPLTIIGTILIALIIVAFVICSLTKKSDIPKIK